METKFVKSPVLDCCPDCNGKLSPVRISKRGTGKDDSNGLYCKKCEVLFEVVYEKDYKEEN